MEINAPLLHGYWLSEEFEKHSILIVSAVIKACPAKINEILPPVRLRAKQGSLPEVYI